MSRTRFPAQLGVTPPRAAPIRSVPQSQLDRPIDQNAVSMAIARALTMAGDLAPTIQVTSARTDAGFVVTARRWHGIQTGRPQHFLVRFEPVETDTLHFKGS